MVVWFTLFVFLSSISSCFIRINFNCSNNTKRCSSGVGKFFVSAVSGKELAVFFCFFTVGGKTGLQFSELPWTELSPPNDSAPNSIF
jgi:hypothetical protein